MLLRLARPLAAVAKTACKSVLKQQMFFMPAMRFSALEKIDQQQQKLLKAVDKEIKYEKENYEMDASVKDFLKQQNLQLIDKENETMMKLIKTVDPYKITICFSARSPPAPEEDQQQQDQQQPIGKNEIAKKNAETDSAQQEEELPELADYCDFQIYIQKKNDKRGILYECSTYDAELSIHSMNVIQNVDEYMAKSKVEKMQVDYNGPDFQTLDERLQTAILDNLKAFGINEEVTAFVEHMSLDKEQRLYIKWLNDLKNYLTQ